MLAPNSSTLSILNNIHNFQIVMAEATAETRFKS